ncbi:YkvA family protein [Xanthobacter sp. DSM 24535]|uniref:YkvA family protein n=1 Tax=Roseixanthobacter psychrophilus TaxID=3119917 RepID=UPI0037289C99
MTNTGRARSRFDWSALPFTERHKAAKDESFVAKGFWQKLKRTAAHVPFAQEAVAAYFAAFDHATPLRVRATLMGALAYFVLPLDSIPDILPAIGFSDDAAVLFLAYRALTSHITPAHHAAANDLVARLRAEGDDGVRDSAPRPDDNARNPVGA